MSSRNGHFIVRKNRRFQSIQNSRHPSGLVSEFSVLVCPCSFIAIDDGLMGVSQVPPRSTSCSSSRRHRSDRRCNQEHTVNVSPLAKKSSQMLVGALLAETIASCQPFLQHWPLASKSRSAHAQPKVVPDLVDDQVRLSFWFQRWRGATVSLRKSAEQMYSYLLLWLFLRSLLHASAERRSDLASRLSGLTIFHLTNWKCSRH